MAMNSNAIQQFSIHASAKEATNFFSDNRISFVFSIHASAKEATPCKRFLVRLRFYFQSTPPRRRRRALRFRFFNSSTIFSIHASAKEATVCLLRYITLSEIFNPRLREGGDP